MENTNTGDQNSMKTFTRRDSATAVLRKMGIDSSEYNKFVEKIGDSFILQVTRAQMHLNSLKTPVSTKEKPSGVSTIAKTPAELGEIASKKEVIKAKYETPAMRTKQSVGKALAKDGAKQDVATKRTVSSVTRDMLVDGKSNVEIWNVIKAEFNLADTKRTYPAWYRSDAKRRGLI